MHGVQVYFHTCETHGHSQAWARGHSPPGKVVKCFDVLVIIVKCSVDQLFMHYFQNICRHRGLRSRPHQGFVYGPRWGRKPQAPNLPAPGKNHAGAHGETPIVLQTFM